MHQFAQTNIQLINQLCRDGYSTTDLSSVLNAYDLAIRLFTGRFRASGKTFIAHLVGTASILGSLHVSPKLVAAGLIHAVYMTGDFGDGNQGISEAKRENVRAVVGDEVENYVGKYTALRWSAESIHSIHEGLDGLAPVDRDVLLVRLANELEEYLDLGILYCGDRKRQQTDYVNDSGQLMMQMAQKLGFPSLVAELGRALKEVSVAELPALLRRTDAQNESFLLAPQSYQRLMEMVAKRLAVAEPRKEDKNHDPSGL